MAFVACWDRYSPYSLFYYYNLIRDLILVLCSWPYLDKIHFLYILEGSVGQGNFANFTEFPFLLFSCPVKKKWRHSFWDFWDFLSLLPLSCPSLSSSLMSLDKQCWNFTGTAAFTHHWSRWKPSCCQLLLSHWPTMFSANAYCLMGSSALRSCLRLLLPAQTVIPCRSCDVGGFCSSVFLLLFKLIGFILFTVLGF